MRLLQIAARAALGWVFIQAGAGVMRAPGIPAEKAKPVLSAVRRVTPLPLPDDVALVRLNAGVQVVAGAALVMGIAPRPAAAVLIASVVPTTAGGHRFWELEAGAERAGQRNHFIKNVSIVGGLLQLLVTPTDHSSARSRRPAA